MSSQAAPSPSPASSRSSFPPRFPPSFENSLLSPISPDVPLDFCPSSFFLLAFPEAPSVSSFVHQLQRSFAQLTARFVVSGDSSADHQAVMKSLEFSLESLTALSEGVKSLEALTGKEAEQIERTGGSAPGEHSEVHRLRTHAVQASRALRSAHLLVALVDALRLLVSSDVSQYSHLLTLVQAIDSIFPLLSVYSEDPLIQGLKALTASAKARVRLSAFRDFYHHLPDLHVNTDLSRLGAAVRLVERLASPEDSRAALVDWWVALKMAPFNALLKGNSQWRDILKLGDLIAWLYKFLQQFDNSGYNRVFPQAWHVEATFTRRWMDAAVLHTTNTLNALTERFDLYKPLKAAVELENFLVTRIQKPQNNENTGTLDEKLFNYSRNLSSCFEPFLNIFIELEQASLEAYVAGLDGTELWTPQDEARHREEGGEAKAALLNADGEMDPRAYYPTVELLFAKLQKSLARYAKLIHNETLFALSKEYRRAVSEYIKKLDNHLPRLQISQNASATAANQAVLAKLTANDLILIVRLCTSGEECLRRCEPFAKEVSAQLDAEFKEFVDFSPIAEAVKSLESRAMSVLVAALVYRIEATIAQMLKENKKDNKDALVKAVAALLKKENPRIAHLGCFSLFLSHFVTKFVAALLSAIKKIPRLDEARAVQLTAECRALREFLVKMEEAGTPGVAQQKIAMKTPVAEEEAAPSDEPADSSFASSYVQLVASEFGKVERFLSVLSVPAAQLIVSFRQRYPKGSPQMLAELLDLRGLSSSEQKSLVKSFNQGLHVSKQIPMELFNKGFMSSFVGDLKKQIEKI